jgi:HD-GYP domain-containing protein (c-di-GMP phosphodiesterase class II)
LLATLADRMTTLLPGVSQRSSAAGGPALPRNKELEAIVGGRTRRRRIAVDTVYWDRTEVEHELLSSHDAFSRTQDLIRDLASEMAKERLPEVERIRDAVTNLVESIVRNPDALMWLAKLKRTDNYTYDHALDVSVHLMAFGRHLGLPLEQLHTVGVAGLMQDIGKINLPLELLKKADSLTLAERAVMKRHVELSGRILAEQPDIPQDVLEIVARHHERFDGGGYPRRLAGDDIGLYAQMSGLVDTYCAMSSDRPYRAAIEHQRVLERLYARRGRNFSESLVIEFVQCIGIYPVGTLVELNTGEVAVVIAQNRVRRLKPRVLVLLAPDKSLNPSPVSLDLIYEPPSADGSSYRILRALQRGAYGLDPREFYL